LADFVCASHCPWPQIIITESRRVFIVEDDRKIAALLADYLHSAGFDTRIFADGHGVVDGVRAQSPDAVILDRMLPISDGLTICQGIRQFSAVPVLMLTARVEEADVLEGLECGADDYVTKPFRVRQVVARISALIRRSQGRLTSNPAEQLFLIDDAAQRAAWRGHWLPLSGSEFQILALMMKHPGRVFSRNQLLDRLGERAQETTDRVIDCHIKNIRRKIAVVDPDATCVTSVYGADYRFET
jgi:two-component system, OmpR family, response regulator BaeR